jgi:hypothetical protein
MKIQFNIKEINNGWLISFYGQNGEECFFVNNAEDMSELIVRICKTRGLASFSDPLKNNSI